MRRCPECHELFGGTEKFCENDGTPLQEVAAAASAPNGWTSRDAWVLATFGLMGGIVLSLFVSAFLFASWGDEGLATREDFERPDPAGTRSAAARPPQMASALRPEATPTPAESPTPEEEEAEQAAAPPPDPAPASTPHPIPAALNQGPVSTGGSRTEGAQGQTLIRLKDGTQVEADAAWEDSQGVWYRRGALVSFVERARVETITGRAQPEAATAAP